MARVDVITPTLRERSALLAEAEESVRRQTFSDIEHWVCCDLNREGPARVRNRLIAQGNAEWLVFLDDDDLLDPTFVEDHLQFAEKTGADMVYGLCRYPPIPEARRRPPIGKFDWARLLRGNYIPVTVLLRRRAFDKTPGFNPSVPFEDYQLWKDLYRTGATIVHLPKVCWTYRLHGNPWKPQL